MNIKVTDDILNDLMSALKEEGKSAVRFELVGFG